MNNIKEKLTPTFWAIVAVCILQVALFTTGRILDAPPEETGRENSHNLCPECKESVKRYASRCPHCTSEID
jgi:uncharacterized paraquat-inducible protein A